ncbi:serine hydrolase domain-containing protein [Hyphobacterium marinum]|uniref:Serine hydrolase n=1 Tax=Hyphobacterium marinum TaxID=3116574 RepID=A0ABU7LYF0_9PROT|nr:serine hydrolase [Hyphobacterium sp. Y6023]MEE2566568.1 serine hydrolase [Hyphobacterium sp. Y6023]
MSRTTLHSLKTALAGLSCVTLCSGALLAQDIPVCDGYPLETAVNPAALGWSDADLAALDVRADEIGTAAMMILQGGEVVYSRGEIERPFLLHSLRKSVMSAMIGVLVDAGALSLDTTLVQLDIDDFGGLTDTERTATVRDIISARSGVYIASAAETQAMADARPERGQYAPGEHWYYNNWDFNVAGHIFERVSHRTYNGAFQRMFAEPLCMQDWNAFDAYRFYTPGTAFAAYHIRISARDLALFGQLMLQDGQWNGAELLSADWVADSTATHSQTGWDGAWAGGYGYMWWKPADDASAEAAGLAPDMYTGAGAGGHYLTVIPSRDMVIVHRMDTDQPGNPRLGMRGYGDLLSLILALGEPD